MKNNLRQLFILILILVGQNVFGQNDFFFNHYMFNPSYYNPGWIGTEKQAFVAAHHRTQWAGYDASFDPEGAPTTQLVSLVVPVKSAISGFGVSVSNDRTGPLSSLQARFSVSYSKKVGFGEFSLGIMPALNFLSTNSNYRFEDGGDRLIPVEGESQLKPNLHAGLYFLSNRNYFIGASVENIIEPGFDFGTDAANIIPINYILMAGTTMGLTRDLILNPTILIRSDLNSYTYDISAVAIYQERMWGGLAFRRGESLSLLLGYSFLENNKLKAGYSFDYVIKNRDAKQPTSHEVFLRYDLPDLVFGGRKAVKTPRFTF
ncbi:PorP/SprF family type IX secretion system membrane protein [Ekhidna sp.]